MDYLGVDHSALSAPVVFSENGIPSMQNIFTEKALEAILDTGGKLPTHRSVDRRMQVITRIGTQCKSDSMRIGRRVRVPLPQGGTDTAVIRYVGFPHFSKARAQPLVGVELEHAIGTHSGTIKGHYYYQCAPRMGLFVEIDDVWTLEPHESSKPQTRGGKFAIKPVVHKPAIRTEL